MNKKSLAKILIVTSLIAGLAGYTTGFKKESGQKLSQKAIDELYGPSTDIDQPFRYKKPEEINTIYEIYKESQLERGVQTD